MQGQNGVERFLCGVFERRLEPVLDLAASGGGGVVEPDAEAEDDAPGDRFRLAGDGGAVGAEGAADLGLRVRVEMAGEVGGGLAYNRQQIGGCGRDCCRRRRFRRAARGRS